MIGLRLEAKTWRGYLLLSSKYGRFSVCICHILLTFVVLFLLFHCSILSVINDPQHSEAAITVLRARGIKKCRDRAIYTKLWGKERMGNLHYLFLTLNSFLDCCPIFLVHVLSPIYISYIYNFCNTLQTQRDRDIAQCLQSVHKLK